MSSMSAALALSAVCLSAQALAAPLVSNGTTGGATEANATCFLYQFRSFTPEQVMPPSFPCTAHACAHLGVAAILGRQGGEKPSGPPSCVRTPRQQAARQGISFAHNEFVNGVGTTVFSLARALTPIIHASAPLAQPSLNTHQGKEGTRPASLPRVGAQEPAESRAQVRSTGGPGASPLTVRADGRR